VALSRRRVRVGGARDEGGGDGAGEEERAQVEQRDKVAVGAVGLGARPRGSSGAAGREEGLERRTPGEQRQEAARHLEGGEVCVDALRSPAAAAEEVVGEGAAWNEEKVMRTVHGGEGGEDRHHL